MFPQIFGKYVLERELASGGMARVFLATLRGAGGFEKRLVVKQIRPELASDQSFIQRFVAEAKTTVDLSHANIVPVYELGAEQGIYYIAMELCAGVSLAELLAAGPASPSEGAYIGVEICRALDYAHRKAGVVHRDVTPRNVMIDAEGMVRLIDFGIAAPASAPRGSGGPLFGSLGHMPPEQLRPGPLTPAADVFAVAVLLVEAWTGRAPFRRESLEASTRALGEPLPPLGSSDPALRALEPLIRGALALAPEQRPQTADELARPLREFLRKDDLGDIARRLGERVSERMLQLANAKASGSRRAPSAAANAADTASGVNGARADQTPALATGSHEQTADRGTQTFATRDVLFQWTAKIDSAPPRPGISSSPETVEIESGVVAPSEPGTAPRLDPGSRRSRARAASIMLAASALSLLGAGHLWSRTRAAAPLDNASLVASRARVTAAPAPLPTAALDLELGRELRVPVAAAVAPEAGALDTPRVDEIKAAAGTPPAHAATLAPALESTNAVAPGQPSTSGVAPARPSARRTAHGERLDHDESVRPSAAPLSARVELTAEPAAWVELDGVRVGRTPLRHFGVSPGRHRLSFVSQLLGEKLDASIDADPHAALSVHADFTSASPQVYVR